MKQKFRSLPAAVQVAVTAVVVVVLAVVFGFLRPSFQELAQLVTISGKPVSDFNLLQTLNNVTGDRKSVV